MHQEFLGVLLMLAVAALLAAAVSLFARRRADRPEVAATGDSAPATGPGRFALAAVAALAVWVGLLALVPWAVAVRALGWPGLGNAVAFALPIGLGIAFLRRKGGLS